MYLGFLFINSQFFDEKSGSSIPDQTDDFDLNFLDIRRSSRNRRQPERFDPFIDRLDDDSVRRTSHR